LLERDVSKSGSQRRHPAVQVVLSSLVTAMMLLVIEGGMRWTGLPDPGLYEGDRARIWWVRGLEHRTLTDPATHRQFEVRTTAEGFRGTAPPRSGPWTLAVGCSTTFGWGVAAEDAWPAQLGKIQGEIIVNAGTPGWSTAQGVRGLGRVLSSVSDNPPARVLLSFGVRDAQYASRSDADAEPTPWLLRTRWALLLGRGGKTSGPYLGGTAGTMRVGAEEFGANTARLIDLVESEGAEARVFVFPQPQPWPPAGYTTSAREAAGKRLLELDPLPREAFFVEDPVHLTPDGHRRLAEQLAGALDE